MPKPSVLLHCGSCEGDDVHLARQRPVLLSNCSGVSSDGRTVHLQSCSASRDTVRLGHCSSHDDGVDLSRCDARPVVRLSHCSGTDHTGHSVRLGHCWGTDHE